MPTGALKCALRTLSKIARGWSPAQPTPGPLAYPPAPLPLRRSAIGEEGGGRDLGGLAAGDRVAGAEVGPVLRVARLSRPTTGVPGDQPVARRPLNPQPERVGVGHIGKRLLLQG